jgi:hypothetical protein
MNKEIYDDEVIHEWGGNQDITETELPSALALQMPTICICEQPPRTSQSIPDADKSEPHPHDPLRKFTPLGRTATSAFVPRTATGLLPHMFGMNEIAKLLFEVIVKPSACGTVYTSTVGRLTGLHFCLVGREGTGRRTALRTVCSMCQVDMLTINSLQYQYGDVDHVIQSACYRRPCVVYFEDYDWLRKMPDFARDFDYQVLAMDLLCNTWNHIWLGFGMTSLAAAKSPPLSYLCADRVACVVDMTEEEKGRLLFNSFLSTGGVDDNRHAMTAEQWQRLVEATREATPADLRAFAGRVIYATLTRMSLNALIAQTDPSLRARFGLEDESRQHSITISWKDDAEPHYEEDESLMAETGTTTYTITKASIRT